MTFNLESGNALTILVVGVLVTVAAVLALSKLPATRPSLTTRLNWWLADSATTGELLASRARNRQRRPAMTELAGEAPTAAIGNLRFTAGGVYAEYLLSGRPFIFLPKEIQDQVADVHADLCRALPSGAILSKLTAPVATRSITRRMIFAHPDLHPETAAPGDPMPAHTERWVQHCQRWAPALDRRRFRKPLYWLHLPLDYGQDGATAAGGWQRRLDSIIGRDKDSDASLAHYRDLAATMAAKLPPALFAKPVSAEQIWWHWNYTASRHTWQLPLPTQPYDPHARLDAAAFSPVWKDPSAASLRGRRWRAARTDADVFLRTYREPSEGIADSYQAIVGLEKYPDAGLRWPNSTIFKVLDDLATPATTLDWAIHFTFESAEVAVATAHNVIVNIKDQARQRGRHADSDDELVRKLVSGRQLASALKQGSAERGVNPAVVVIAASASPEETDTAMSEVIRRYRSQKLELKRRRGSQVTLSRALVPGSESSAALHEIRNPSTAASFGKFVPLLSTSLGNNVGVPLGETITSPGVPEVVLNDLLGAPSRDNPGNLVIGGAPGRGKSQLSKNLIRSWLEFGAGLHLIDPTEAREHERALSTFDDDKKVIIDPKKPKFSLDGLRIFPFDEAAERTVDHLLPQMGFASSSPQAARLKGLLAPESRTANGIGSLSRLIALLGERRPDRASVDDDLLDRAGRASRRTAASADVRRQLADPGSVRAAGHLEFRRPETAHRHRGISAPPAPPEHPESACSPGPLRDGRRPGAIAVLFPQHSTRRLGGRGVRGLDPLARWAALRQHGDPPGPQSLDAIRRHQPGPAQRLRCPGGRIH